MIQRRIDKIWASQTSINDNDGTDVFKNLGDFMDAVGLDVLSLSYLTPLPGTRLFERLRREGRLIYDDFPADWAKYDCDQVVFRPKNMTLEELVRGNRYVITRKYSRGKVLQQLFRTLGATKNLTSALFAYELNKGIWETLVRDRDYGQSSR